MNATTARECFDILNDNGFDVSLREDYSGRGMFGATTFAIVLSSRYDLNDARKVCPRLCETRWDSMGMGVVLY